MRGGHNRAWLALRTASGTLHTLTSANQGQDLLVEFVPSEDRICARRKEDLFDWLFSETGSKIFFYAKELFVNI